jgi:hypothetical protein
MKKLCLLILSTMVAFSVFAQTEKGYVYLKNGSIVKGKYSYLENKQKIKVHSSGNTWIFDASEVENITAKRIHSSEEFESMASITKLFFRTELGVLVGSSENSQTAPFSLTGSVNYRINPNLSAGLGLGLEFFNETYLPVFANFEYKLRQKASSPYVFLKAGYQLPLEESNAIYYDNYPVWSLSSFWPGPYYGVQEGFDTNGGFLINPGVGYQQMFTPGFGMNFAIGYQFHRLNYEGEDDYTLDIDYNRLTIKVGIIFN